MCTDMHMGKGLWPRSAYHFSLYIQNRPSLTAQYLFMLGMLCFLKHLRRRFETKQYCAVGGCQQVRPIIVTLKAGLKAYSQASLQAAETPRHERLNQNDQWGALQGAP